MFLTGLNPYGLTYYLGLQGQGTARANPAGLGLPGFEQIALDLGASSIEFHCPWFTDFSVEDFHRLRERLEDASLIPVISLGPPLEGVDLALRAAIALGAPTIRLGLSPVLCGDRAAWGARWPEMVSHARSTLRTLAPRAAEHGVALAIEDHQDFGSQELVDFAVEAGPNVGITLDTGNPLAVGEDILGFTRRVASFVRHVHWKDYRVQWTADGYRLVRCAIGDGCVPFSAVGQILDSSQPLTASLEPGALEVRHVRLFTTPWWEGYPPRAAAEFAPCLADARRSLIPEGDDCRTPWERNDPPETLVAYELGMIRRSASNMRALGLMK